MLCALVSDMALSIQKLSGRYDLHAAKRIQNEQVVIACDKHCRVSIDRQIKDMIVFWSAAYVDELRDGDQFGFPHQRVEKIHANLAGDIPVESVTR